MKTLIIYLMCGLIFVGCSSAAIDKKLNEIECLIDANPELALSALDSINPSQIKTESQNALYALLYSQTLDKNYIDTTNDSLISVAVRYFNKSDDAYRKMLAHYYHGRVRYNAKDFPHSLSAMTKALNAADEVGDYYWKGRIAEQIANIYDANFHGEDAIYYANVAVENLRKSGRQPFINYALLNLARIKGNNDDHESAIKLSWQVVDSSKLYKDTYLYTECFDILAANYVGKKDYNTAVDVFETLKQLKPLEGRQQSLYGISYLAIGNIVMAEKIFEGIPAINDKDKLSLTYQLYKTRGEYELAIEVLNSMFNDLDSALVSSMKQNFGQTLSDVYQDEQYQIETELKKERINRYLIIALGVITIIIIVATFLRWSQVHKKRLEKYIYIAHNLQEILSVKERGYAEVTKTVKELIESRFEVIDDLSRMVYEYKATGLVKKKIAAEVEYLIEQMSSDPRKIAELEEIVNANCSNVLISLKCDLPNLKSEDYMLYLYSVLGFSISAIALFLKVDKLEQVYNRKARLKTKIRTLSPEKAELYLGCIS